MDGPSLAMSCTPTEAAFLAGLLGADMLVGMADPFHGWLVDEIEAAWIAARQKLARRRYIEVQPDGKIIMDVGVATLMETWAQAQISLLLTWTTSNGLAQNCSFHLRTPWALEQRISADGVIRLTSLADAAAVYRRIVQSLQLQRQPAAPGASAALPETVFVRARTAAAGQGTIAAREMLREAQLPAVIAEALAEALTTPVVNGAVVALARLSAGWDVAGMGVLEGPAGLWRLRAFTREGENWVEVIPCRAQEAREELRRVLNRVLPKPLVAVEEI